MGRIHGLTGFLIFAKEIFAHPARVGAIFPSSKGLAKEMAQQIVLPVPADKFILELGAGTGVMTQALINHGIPSKQIIAVERAKNLAQHLEQRFPESQIIQGDAQHLSELLQNKAHQIGAVVSSLPLRSLPSEMVSAIGDQLADILEKDTPFIQFTYSFSNEHTAPSPHLKPQHTKRIWFNVPPARVEVYSWV